MNASMSTPAARSFLARLAEYTRLRSTVDPSEIVQRKSKSLAIELYKAAKATAPTRAKIAADVERLGWRVKRPPGAWPLRKGEKRGSKGPLRRMQAAAVKRRARASGFVASGFIPAMKALNANVAGSAASNFPHPQGSCQQTGLGMARPTVVIANSTPGIGAVQAKHSITDTAFKAVEKDMQQYIDRKTQQTARQSKR